MDSSDLTKEQAATLNTQFGRMLRYLNNLEKRMRAMDFPEADPIRSEATKARNCGNFFPVFLRRWAAAALTQSSRRSFARTT